MFARFFAKVRAWLILTRGSNLPTVWSNLFAGWLLGYVYADRFPWGPFLLTSLIGLLIGVSLIYVGGMILNDAFDARWDTERRSTRPIPSGLVSVTVAHVVGFLCLAIGSWFTVVSSLDGHGRATFTLVVLLVASVLVYDRWHKGVSWAPAVMGLCRALLPAIGFLVVGESIFFPPLADSDRILFAHMFALWLLTYAITLVARHEATGGGAGRWVEALLFVAPVPLFWAVGFFWPWTLVWSAAYAWWLVRSNRRHPLPEGVGARVADRLASMPLIDAMTNGYLVFICVSVLLRRKGVHPEALFDVACLLLLALGVAPFAMRLVLRWRKQIPST